MLICQGSDFTRKDSMPERPNTDKNDGAVLTLEEANALEWRELDPKELDSLVDSVWETVDKLREAQTVSKETLASEIKFRYRQAR